MIKGLSDRLRLPRLGKLRLGEKQVSKKTGKEHPVALDYFVIPEQVKAIYGEKPRQLDVMLPMEDKGIFFPVFYKRYGSSKGLICKGDGEQATEIDEGNGDMKEIECPGKECDHFQDGSCKSIGNLQVVLHKVPGLGIYQIDTSSYNSIVNINSGVEMIRGMLGRISWVPLVLKVEMQEAHPRVNGNRIKTVIPVMSLTADVSVEEILEGVKKGTVRLPGPEKQAEIDNPDVDEKEELLYPAKDGNLESSGEPVKPKKSGPTRSASEAKEIPKEKATQDKEGELFSPEKEKPARNRNQLNIVFHKIKKRLMSADIWDEEKYRAWLKEEFKVKSSKDLSGKQMVRGIEIMDQLWNDQLDKEK